MITTARKMTATATHGYEATYFHKFLAGHEMYDHSLLKKPLDVNHLAKRAPYAIPPPTLAINSFLEVATAPPSSSKESQSEKPKVD